MQKSSVWEERALAVVHLEDCHAGELLCAKGAGVLVGSELNVSLQHALAAEGQQPPELYKQEHGQHNEGSYYALLLGTSKTTPGTLYPVAEGQILEGCPVHEGC